jgi:hypothetical protein
VVLLPRAAGGLGFGFAVCAGAGFAGAGFAGAGLAGCAGAGFAACAEGVTGIASAAARAIIVVN